MRVTYRDAARDYLVAQTLAGHVTPARGASWVVGDWKTADLHGTAATLLARLPADGSHQEFRTAILGHIAYQHRTNEAVELATRFQAELDSGAVECLACYLADDDSRHQWSGHSARDQMGSLDFPDESKGTSSSRHGSGCLSLRLEAATTLALRLRNSTGPRSHSICVEAAARKRRFACREAAGGCCQFDVTARRMKSLAGPPGRV